MLKILFVLTFCWGAAVPDHRRPCGGPRECIYDKCGDAREEKPCPQTKYLFPNSGQITDYIRVKTPFQQSSKVTICAWVTPLSGQFLATTSIFSYAIPSHHNELLLYFGRGTFEPTLSQVSRTIDLVVDRRTHICLAINKPNALVYVNGDVNGTLTYSGSDPMKGGGAIIIGQEQDSVLGDYDSDQAFSGTIENLMLWYRVLPGDQIRDLFMDPCNCPGDYEIALTPDEVQLEGGVLPQPIDQC